MKSKLTMAIVAGVVLIGGALYLWQQNDASFADNTNSSHQAVDVLKSFVETANQVSGIESGAAFNYSLVGSGNPSNYGILRCRDEVRCDNAVPKQVAKFQQPNQPSPDTAEVDTDTNAVVSLHRAVPSFVGGELPETEIERRVRDFLARVYPDFAAAEPTLTFDPGMKGVRLNNGNYFYRWNDDAFTLPDGLSAEVQPFVQVGITASGFIFSYDNTIDLYHDALSEL